MLSPLAVDISRVSDGMVMLINEANQNILGYPPAEIEGRTTAELDIWVNSEDRHRLVRELDARGHCWGFLTEMRSKSGEYRGILLDCTLFLYAD